MAILEKIEEIPAKQRILIFSVVLLLIAGGFYQFVYSKKAQQIETLQSELSTHNSELQELRVIQKKLEEFRSMIKELESQLEVAQRQLPRQKEIPVLLNDISKFGKETGMEFKSFRPSREVSKGFYAEVPINLVISGPFHNIAQFVDQIVHYPRIVKISNISIGNAKEVEGHIMLQATAKATTFRYLDEDK
jgi:type IV pilus assembly protein PilO